MKTIFVITDRDSGNRAELAKEENIYFVNFFSKDGTCFDGSEILTSDFEYAFGQIMPEDFNLNDYELEVKGNL